MAKVGILGGSGLYQLEGMKVVDNLSLLTPFGEPSCNYVVGKFKDVDIVFMPRHGKGHRISPSEINYRANIWGMKKLGVDAILTVCACGSLKEEMKPQDFVVPDQLVDWTRGKREQSFFTEGIVAHIPFAEPFSPELREVLIEAAKEVGVKVHEKATYINMEGPQFSTLAESNLYRSWGMDIIGMTTATEAKLAREAEISYAALAAVTDYDCWHPSHDSVTVEMIIENLNNNIYNAKKILELVIPRVGKMPQFSAQGVMKNSIITNRQMIPEQKRRQLEIIIGKYLT